MAGVSASCVQDNKQTNKQNSKMTTRLKRARRKKLKFRIWCKSVHKQRNGRGFSENAESAWAKSWASCAVIGRNKKLTTRKRTRFSRGIWSSFKCCVFVIGCAWNRLIYKETRTWKHLPVSHWPLQQPNGKEQFLLPKESGATAQWKGAVPPQRQCRDFSKSSQILSIPALAWGKTAAAGRIVGHGISG